MIIRRNTKAFKTIVEIVASCETRGDREKLIRVFITKAGHTVKDRINVEGIQGDTAVFYDLNYAAVLTNLNSTGHQLHQSDDEPGIYFFHSSSNKAWDENPFEFDTRVAEVFASLSDLPNTRKREKPVKVESLPKRKAEPLKKEAAEKHKKDGKKKEPAVQEEPAPRQPSYKIDRKIIFTELDKVVMRQPNLTKRNILDYYNKMAEYMLPYLKDRPQVIRLHADRGLAKDYADAQTLAQEGLVEMPEWIQTAAVTEGKQKRKLLLCNNKEHLLLYVEKGCITFYTTHARAKSLDAPDYAIIGIESAEDAVDKVTHVAGMAHHILDGLQLPSFVKTDGLSGLHVYIPLDAKSDTSASMQAAEMICKLVRLKIPDVVALKDTDDAAYGKVTLDFKLNEAGKSVVAPYSLLPGTAMVATPLFWEEVGADLRTEQFNHETIFKRLKDTGDPFDSLFKKRIDAAALCEKLDTHYSFLL
jgi:bifunctional non-homologous end joining protein LigD